jgi:manganese/iron transport system permease protein/iron/zinc/copper transport system permease protein
VAAAVAAVLFLLYKQLLFVTFDPDVAASYGVRTGVVDVAFSLVLAAAIIATMRILGVTLIAAAVVTPAVVARLTSDSFARMLGLSVLIGALTGFGGMYVSYYGDIASGATVTLTGAAVFAVVYVGGLARARRRRRSARAAGGEGEALVGFAARARTIAGVDLH